MRTSRPLAALTVALLAAACGVKAPQKQADPRLRDDLGGFTPSEALMEAASALGDPTRKAAAVAMLEKAPAAERIDVYRAGLRLRDDAAAHACAARLTYQQIDRWECARCVDLLVSDVLKPGTEADFEEFRSYLGSVELPRYFRSLPPLPWAVNRIQAIGQMHRVALGRHLPLYVDLTNHPDDDVARTAWSQIGLLSGWNDEHREDVTRRDLESERQPVPGPADGPGLPPLLAAWLRWQYLDRGREWDSSGSEGIGGSELRWCWDSTPGPRDVDLLMALAKRDPSNEFTSAGVALLLMGKLSDDVTGAYLRQRVAEDDEELAVWALARRGDAAMIARTAEEARGDENALAALMEADPAAARRLFESVVLRGDDAAADELLENLAKFAVPGAWWEPFGFDWRRTSFAGFDRAAIDAHVPAGRLARIGVIVPGCRTRELAAAVVATLRPGDLAGIGEEAAGFLETAAPEPFVTALRRIREAGGDDTGLAARWLVALDDPETAAALLDAPDAWDLADLARSRAPQVREFLVLRVRADLDDAAPSKTLGPDTAALAIAGGLPELAAWALTVDPPRAAVEAVLAGRPADGVAAVLAGRPDAMHGPVGALDDPRVRSYLVRLRQRRDLGHFWYASGQLAVLGDPAAKADFWGAMQDGRYRIINDAEFFDRTLGHDFARTMPFWIDELKSQCCRIVTGGGDIAEVFLGLDQGCFNSPYRTPWRRAREVWDTAGGRFVRSRILGSVWNPRWVAEPR